MRQNQLAVADDPQYLESDCLEQSNRRNRQLDQLVAGAVTCERLPV
jgi:hypothetical protein